MKDQRRGRPSWPPNAQGRHKAGPCRRGAVLLEVVATLAIFTFVALAALELVNQLSASERRTAHEATILADQDRLLTAMSFLTAADLDLRLGARTAGAYTIVVQRPESLLYRVSIGDSAGPRLTTLLYRRERP